MLHLMAFTMDPRYKLKGVHFCMHRVYANIHIDEKDKDVIKEKDVIDSLEQMYKPYDQRYSHFKEFRSFMFFGCFKFGFLNFPIDVGC